ncbi:dTDP-4-dehydrorhamnose 3,5-epimerase family protein [Microbacterium ulmi]|uniref:dTDP-4-dehydrorhamnose 3,5-epimerase family protein n=1 Tax=Microbacterium ulmi TaxID=179095 RepID=A0A7Y2LYT1_9MICO|nr:dTDP-4-dehydrorhamnose 3,5-epimerase family protein [Microbacterium ulmi]NII69749.1 dTDP-4-dehydrorhamnose 3,5-epimerase [Microbacterium ulmi]NNH03277.1 dTDP-4-dehydrorhamnose 3,5-epimerase family protein [Microbacterium ulmi]
MKFHTTGIPGVVVFEPTPIRDHRGFFTRTLDVSVLRDAGIDPASFVQENQSRSSQGGIRGLHGRLGDGEAKLARCARGAVLDVVLDARPGSPTFGRVETFVLDDVDHRQVYVPGGCLHGYQVLSDEADFCYRSDVFYAPGEVAVHPLDPELGIPWRTPYGELSARDASSPSWRAFATDVLGATLPPPVE